jgi:hypothetical protein
MKTSLSSLVILAVASSTVLFAEKKPQDPIPVTTAPVTPAPMSADGGDYQQRLYGPAGSLVSPEKANQVISAFRPAYEKLGKPRVLIYMNRELVDENSGLKLTGRTEKTETVHTEKKSEFESDPNATKAAPANPQTQVNVAVGGGSAGNGSSDTPGKGSAESRSAKVTGENTYTADNKPARATADRQTVRDVERLVGRPLRSAGVSLADQKVASSLIADRPLDHFTTPTNESARKDREALAKVADVVIEVLMSSRNMTVKEVSGDKTVTGPDLQLTAIRLSDSAIIGQASATDVLGKDQQAGRIVSQYDIHDITEATALALMEDIALTAK